MLLVGFPRDFEPKVRAQENLTMMSQKRWWDERVNVRLQARFTEKMTLSTVVKTFIDAQTNLRTLIDLKKEDFRLAGIVTKMIRTVLARGEARYFVCGDGHGNRVLRLCFLGPPFARTREQPPKGVLAVAEKEEIFELLGRDGWLVARSDELHQAVPVLYDKEEQAIAATQTKQKRPPAQIYYLTFVVVQELPDRRMVGLVVDGVARELAVASRI